LQKFIRNHIDPGYSGPVGSIEIMDENTHSFFHGWVSTLLFLIAVISFMFEGIVLFDEWYWKWWTVVFALA